jgi:outer membrane protein TolC
MVGQERLHRIQSEHSGMSAKFAKADNDVKTASAYFNFLLNEPLLNGIIIDSLLLNKKVTSVNIDSEGSDREELKQVSSIIRSAEYYRKLKRSYFMPVISNITDIGYQGYSFSFNKDQQYIMNTINLSWPLFSGLQNQNKIAQASVDTEALQHKFTETEQQIELQCAIAEGSFISALKSEEAGMSAFISSREYYKIINAQYGIGQKSLLDLIDAQNQLIGSEIAYQVSHFESLIKYAELERVNAQIDLNQFTQKIQQ